MKPRLIIIRGYPGSGKTTIGKLLAANGYGVFIDHNAILTFLANIVGDDSGIYDEIHALEIAMARQVIQKGGSVIVARGFSAESLIGPYLNMAKSVGVGVVVLKLNVSGHNLRSRVAASERKNDFNPTTTEEALAEWVRNNPLESIQGECEINADEPIGSVLAQIAGILSHDADNGA